jgi:hypothetical protein
MSAMRKKNAERAKQRRYTARYPTADSHCQVGLRFKRAVALESFELQNGTYKQRHSFVYIQLYYIRTIIYTNPSFYGKEAFVGSCLLCESSLNKYEFPINLTLSLISPITELPAIKMPQLTVVSTTVQRNPPYYFPQTTLNH